MNLGHWGAVLGLTLFLSSHFLEASAEGTCDPPCSEHGKCQAGKCKCRPGWRGDVCDTQECTPECVNGFCESGSCACFTGWGGVSCEEKTTECEPGCVNGGKCVRGKCKCPDKWTGTSCETKKVVVPSKNECGCVNGGKCVGGKCKCPDKWTGATCEVKRAPNVGPTLASGKCNPSCQNGGKCMRGKCKCPPKWKGAACDVKSKPRKVLTGECEPACKNGGKCVRGTCKCPDKWTGRICDKKKKPVKVDKKKKPVKVLHTVLEECEPACLNGGKCVGAKCKCPPKWKGVTCNIKNKPGKVPSGSDTSELSAKVEELTEKLELVMQENVKFKETLANLDSSVTTVWDKVTEYHGEQTTKSTSLEQELEDAKTNVKLLTDKVTAIISTDTNTQDKNVKVRLDMLEEKCGDATLIRSDLDTVVARVGRIENNIRKVIGDIIHVSEAMEILEFTDVDVKKKVKQLAVHVQKVEKLVAGISSGAPSSGTATVDGNLITMVVALSSDANKMKDDITKIEQFTQSYTDEMRNLKDDVGRLYHNVSVVGYDVGTVIFSQQETSKRLSSSESGIRRNKKSVDSLITNLEELSSGDKVVTGGAVEKHKEGQLTELKEVVKQLRKLVNHVETSVSQCVKLGDAEKNSVVFDIGLSTSYKASTTIIKFDMVYSNKNADIQNGIFVVKLAGIYYFTMTSISNSEITTNLPLYIVKRTTEGARWSKVAGVRGVNNVLSMSTIIFLDAGDQVAVEKKIHATILDNSNHFTHFTGQRIL